MREKKKAAEKTEAEQKELPLYHGLKEMKCSEGEIALAKRIKFGNGDHYRTNRYKKLESIRNESIFGKKSEKAIEMEKLKNKISSLPKITQKLLLKGQKPMQNWNQCKPKIVPVVKGGPSAANGVEHQQIPQITK